MRIKILFFFIVLFSYVSHHAFAENIRAQIGVWHNNQPVAVNAMLPEFINGILENDLIQIENVPDNFVKDVNDCYCFDINDERFAYVHAYYYATRQIQEYNFLLHSLGLRKIKNLVIHLQKSPIGVMPHGSADWDGEINISYSRPAFDISFMAHEIGHEIHGLLIGKKIQDVFKIPPDDWTFLYHKLGIIEGAANLLSSLHLGSLSIGKYDWYDAEINIDNFIRFPDLVPTVKDGFIWKIDSIIFSTHYPETVKLLKKELEESHFPEILNQPDPYVVSAVINQPLWNASIRFGIRTIQELLLEALANFKDLGSYSDFANTLIVIASKNPEMQHYLKSEFLKRGLQVKE